MKTTCACGIERSADDPLNPSCPCVEAYRAVCDKVGIAPVIDSLPSLLYTTGKGTEYLKELGWNIPLGHGLCVHEGQLTVMPQSESGGVWIDITEALS